MQGTNVIVEDILSYIKKCGGAFSGWYVGISKDARNRLFNEHRVRENGDAWIYHTANSSNEAREIEAYFVHVLGTDGGTGGGEYNSTMVYAYLKTPHSNP